MPETKEEPTSRRPPADVLRQLRREVGFTCPVCGSPFLSWHHFDPPYHAQPHHNPEGMIALCPCHHKMADCGVYSAAHLRKLKHRHHNPGRIACPWPWEPENVAFILGGNILFGPCPVLSVDGDEVLTARRNLLLSDESQSIVFDLCLRSRDGDDIARIDGNVFEAFTPDLKDFRFTPGANVFRVEHASGVELGLEFRRYKQDAFLRRAQIALDDKKLAALAVRSAARLSADSEGKIPVVSIAGSILTRNVTLLISARGIETTMHCYREQKATVRGHLLMPGGVLRVCVGDSEILRFG